MRFTQLIKHKWLSSGFFQWNSHVSNNRLFNLGRFHCTIGFGVIINYVITWTIKSLRKTGNIRIHSTSFVGTMKAKLNPVTTQFKISQLNTRLHDSTNMVLQQCLACNTMVGLLYADYTSFSTLFWSLMSVINLIMSSLCKSSGTFHPGFVFALNSQSQRFRPPSLLPCRPHNDNCF